MVLERQSQQANTNVNEKYFINIKENITMETENGKRIHYQIYYAQESENCYKNLISQEQPYAPAKFGTKVKENTPTYELPIHSKPLWIILIVKSYFSKKDKPVGQKK